jgi:acyl carrier protein
MVKASKHAASDLKTHLYEQMLSQVDLPPVVREMAARCDLLVEVGPGQTLSGLAADILSKPHACLPSSERQGDFGNLNRVLARAFVGGCEMNWQAVHQRRLVRPFMPASRRQFIDNPCERPFIDTTVEPSVMRSVAGRLEDDLRESIGIDSSQFQNYLQRRQPFLREIIRADLASLDQAIGMFTDRSGKEDQAEPERHASVCTVGLLEGAARQADWDAGRSDPESSFTKSQESSATHQEAEKNGQRTDLVAMLVALAAERTGFPAESISGHDRLLDDLNLDSIKAAELVADAAKRLGLAAEIDPSLFANARLAEIALALAERHPTPTGVEPVIGSVTADSGFDPGDSVPVNSSESETGSHVTREAGTRTARAGSPAKPSPSLTRNLTAGKGSDRNSSDFWIRDFILEYVVSD